MLDTILITVDKPLIGRVFTAVVGSDTFQLFLSFSF